MVLVVNKLVVGMIVSFLFSVIWGITLELSIIEACSGTTTGLGRCRILRDAWLSILVLGSFAFLGTSGFYIRNRVRSKQETQNQALEFDH